MKSLKTEKVSITVEQRVLCDSLTISFAPGRLVGLIGPNGCGKTTLLHTLAGLRSPCAGKVTLDEMDIVTLSPRTIAQSIALLFQDIQDPFQQTVWEHCLASRFPHRSYFKKVSSADEEIVMQALQHMQMEAFLSRKTQALSGGEKRRLALAAVLGQTPTIFLLDEPLNHLDVRHQIMTLQLFQTLARDHGKTIILSLHDMNWVQRFCDDVIMMMPGGNLLHGPVSTLLTSDHLFQLFGCPFVGMESTRGVFWGAG